MHINAKFLRFLIAVAALSTLPPLRSADIVDPAAYDANKDGMLSSDELVRYVVDRDKLRPDVTQYLDSHFKFVAPSAEEAASTQRPKTLEQAVEKSLTEQAGFLVGAIKAELGEAESYPIKDVYEYDDIFVASDGSLTKDNPASAPAIPGIWKEPKKTARYNLGPVQIRKNRDERSKDKLDSVSGATVSFSHDRVESKKTRVSEGAIIYPINRLNDAGKKGPWTFFPSLGWNFSRISVPVKEGDTPSTDPLKGEADEVRFDLGFEYVAPTPGGGAIRRLSTDFSPYLITDSKFRGLIGGAQLEFTPYVQTEKFALNTSYKGPISGTPLKYRLTLVPLVDFNRVYYESRFVDRDDTKSHLGAGFRSEAGIKTVGSPSLEILVSYKFLQGLDDSERYSDLFGASLKLWLNENTGVSFERKKGETPVAEKEVDLTTLGLEVKF